VVYGTALSKSNLQVFLSASIVIFVLMGGHGQLRPTQSGQCEYERAVSAAVTARYTESCFRTCAWHPSLAALLALFQVADSESVAPASTSFSV
jgi:hypothetical protein